MTRARRPARCPSGTFDRFGRECRSSVAGSANGTFACWLRAKVPFTSRGRAVPGPGVHASPLFSAPCAITPTAPTRPQGGWPGWHHYRIPWPVWLPSPTWRHARSRRDRHCRVPTRLSGGPDPLSQGDHRIVALLVGWTGSPAGPGGKTSISPSDHAIGVFHLGHRPTRTRSEPEPRSQLRTLRSPE
jgi:hypothetical protein